MIFISYRRDSGSDLARSIRSELERRGDSVFLDVEDLRSSPFNTALLREIESCSAAKRNHLTASCSSSAMLRPGPGKSTASAFRD